jgi:hypothetical protein
MEHHYPSSVVEREEALAGRVHASHRAATNHHHRHSTEELKGKHASNGQEAGMGRAEEPA